MPARTRLALALLLASGVAAFECWGGLVSRSLALLGDAVHVCTDVFALAIALVASIAAGLPANRRKTFGYGRIEVLGALANAALLLGATIFLVYEAALRFRTPVEPHAVTMSAVAAVGLAANACIALTLSHGGGARTNINMRAALFHVAGDALGAIAVIVGGIAIALTHRAWIDPLLTLFVAAIVVSGIVRLVRDAADIVLESAPPGLDSHQLERALRAVSGVAGVHDLHVWTIGASSPALSAHVLLDDAFVTAAPRVLDDVRRIAREAYGVHHVTIQLEAEHCDPGGIVICRPDNP